MIIYSVYDDLTDPWWRRSADVLRASLARHEPGAQVEIERAPLASRGARSSYAANAAKSSLWAARVEAAQDGEIVILLDSDVYVRGSLAELVPPDRNLVVTPKYWADSEPLLNNRRLPINCGVIGVRVTKHARDAISYWDDVTQRMLADRTLHARWEARWGGIHQAALGYVRDHSPMLLEAAKIGYAPAARWNACHGPLWTADPEGVSVVHVKSDLRQRVRRRATMGTLGRLVREWWGHLGADVPGLGRGTIDGGER